MNFSTRHMKITIYSVFFILLISLNAFADNDLLNIEGVENENPILSDQSQIEVGDKKISDAEIENRLNNVYQNIESLKNIAATVDSGVITLNGSIFSKDNHTKALELANRTQGVVSINDQITLEKNISKRVNKLNEKLLDSLTSAYENLPLYFLALAVFVIFWLLARVISSWTFLFKRLSSNSFLQTLLKQIVRGLIIIIGFVIALEILDATALLGTILGAAGIFGLAIGFAIRDTVENYIASILLSIRQPFQPNDHIVLEGYEGKIIRLTSRDTILMTLDGNHVRIPNATVYKGNILNYSRNPSRRFTFEVGIDTEVEIAAAQKVAIETLLTTPGVIDNPSPQCKVKLLGDSNVVLTLTGWTDQDHYDFNKVTSEAIRTIKQAYDDANFEMPEPIYRLKINGSTGGILDEKSSEKITSSAKPIRATVTEVAADISKETHIDEQIEKEKIVDNEEDLLHSANK